MEPPRVCLLCTLGLAVIVVVFFIGWGSRGAAPSVSPWSRGESLVSQLERLRDGMRARDIGEHLWELTREPHVSGTEPGLRLAKRVRDRWLSWGVPHARLVPYDVLLSHPDPRRHSGVSLVDAEGVPVFNSSLTEGVPEGYANATGILPPYNAYSAQGAPEGDPVYVNYGRTEDFALLLWLGVNVSGRIALARYGKVFRGNKVRNAQRMGALGVILYSDPADYAAPGVAAAPAGWNLPPDGVQRGNVLLADGAGDPLTPGYPATEYAYRRNISDGVGLPTIPVHPISARDAAHILRGMGGRPPPNPEWVGGLNVSYNLGPGFNSPQESWKVRMWVWSQNSVKRIYNVVGTIPGETEPDRWVILGGHRDTWVFGGIDPMTGAATLQEVARVAGGMVRSGWRPRRTLLLCSWDAEEFGLQGSTEWVEENAQLLLSRAVAYINADSGIEGNYTLRVDSSPMLHELVYNITRQVPSPDPGEEGRSLYHTWAERNPSQTNQSVPNINKLGSGSDFEPFFQRLGITAARARYTKNKLSRYSGYPAYHSSYETFELVSRFYDPGFTRLLSVARVRGMLALALACSPLLPFDPRDYAARLRAHADSVRGLAQERGVEARQGFDELLRAIDEFKAAAEKFHDVLAAIETSDPLTLRMANDRLMLLERAFTDPLGLPGRPFYRHVIFAPSSHNKYAGEAFPAVYDSLFASDSGGGETRRQLAIATFAVRSAASSLRWEPAY